MKKKFISNKIEIYERVYNESKTNISLIQNLRNKKPNSFIINFKLLKNHTNKILHIDKLNDRRLISYSKELVI